MTPSLPDSPPMAAQPPALTGRDIIVVFLGLAGGLVVVFGAIIAAGARGLSVSSLLAPSIMVNAGSFLIQALLMTAPVYFFVLRRRRLPFSVIGLKPFARRWYVIVPVVAVAVAFAGEAAESLAGRPLEAPMLRALAPEGFTWVGLVAMLVVGALVAPFAEEVFFRGVLYTWLRNRWGPVVGVIGSSLVFGLFHLQPFWIAFAAFIGVALALVYEFSGSLWPAIGLHVLNNTVSIIWLYAVIA